MAASRSVSTTPSLYSGGWTRDSEAGEDVADYRKLIRSISDRKLEQQRAMGLA
jgi:hypothetical protein